MLIVRGGDDPSSYAIPVGAFDVRQQMLDPSMGAQGVQALAGLGEQIQGAEQKTSQTVVGLRQMKDQAAVPAEGRLIVEGGQRQL